jgi:glycosyltransferase involved in cell wall biosynthesis
MEKFISIVIPNYNNEATIGKCLEAAFSSDYTNFEVIVVDDHSDDSSVEIIRKFPCKLISVQKRSGTSKARNAGAQNSKGEIIFFTDADCLLQKDTLSIINNIFPEVDTDLIIGGTYTRMPYDGSFYSIFQSEFVNYFETKSATHPDYIAAHAMIIGSAYFKESGGFPEIFLPIIEDVEFSHRVKKAGGKLIMQPSIQVQHIFDFSLVRSLRNAFRKTTYWTMYSLKNNDLLTDSGCASKELKVDVISFVISLILLISWILLQKPVFLYMLLFTFFSNIIINRQLFKAFYESGSCLFAIKAILYYMVIYPLPVGLGTITGVVKHFTSSQESWSKAKGHDRYNRRPAPCELSSTVNEEESG